MNPYYAALPGPCRRRWIVRRADRAAVPAVRLLRRAGRGARDRHDGFGRRDGPRNDRAPERTAAHRVGVVQVHLFRPFSSRRSHRGDSVDRRSIAVLDRTKEPGATGEPLYQDVHDGIREAVATGRASVHASHRRRPLRAVVEGVHAGDGQGGVRQSGGDRAEESFHGGHQR